MIQTSLKLVPKSPINNKQALVQVVAWHQTGNKPLPEPMITQFTSAQGGGELSECFWISQFTNYDLLM